MLNLIKRLFKKASPKTLAIATMRRLDARRHIHNGDIQVGDLAEIEFRDGRRTDVKITKIVASRDGTYQIIAEVPDNFQAEHWESCKMHIHFLYLHLGA